MAEQAASDPLTRVRFPYTAPIEAIIMKKKIADLTMGEFCRIMQNNPKIIDSDDIIWFEKRYDEVFCIDGDIDLNKEIEVDEN